MYRRGHSGDMVAAPVPHWQLGIDVGLLDGPYFGNPNTTRQGLRAGIGTREDRFSGPALALLSGLLGTAPHEQGGSVLDQTSERNSPIAANTGFALGLGAQAFPLGKALFSLGKTAKIGASQASKSASILDPKPTAQRPFNADYPGPAPSDASGRLLFDIEGRPLQARYVAGRNMAGMVDEPLQAPGSAGIAEFLGVRSSETARSGKELGGDFGRYVSDRYPGTDIRDPGRVKEIFTDKALDATSGARVFSHEVSHAIDDIAGRIPTDGLKKELAGLYEQLNTAGWYKPGRGMTPGGFGYKGGDMDRELIAEAIRAYKRDPNYIKTVAPKTAARIREYVNSNPNLNKVIQFNSAGGAMAGGLLGGEYNKE